MLTVPGQPACSCEQEIVTGGRSRTGCAFAISSASVQAITVSVASGRYGPCCSKLPTGSTATGTSGTSALVCIGNMPQLCRIRRACGSAPEQFPDEPAHLLDLGEEAVVAGRRLDHPQPVRARDAAASSACWDSG